VVRVAKDRTITICPPGPGGGRTPAEHLRRTALEALADEPDDLVIDLRDVVDTAEALHALHGVQDAAREHHCHVTFELRGLTVSIDQGVSPVG
jgi:hypothetical protein